MNQINKYIMKIGEKINHEEFTTGHRPFYGMDEFVNEVSKNVKVWSWGAHAWTKMNDYCLRFMVQGHHHKGHVYLVVNASDEFDIYLTTSNGTIKDILISINLYGIIDVLDKKIEYITEYKNN